LCSPRPRFNRSRVGAMREPYRAEKTPVQITIGSTFNPHALLPFRSPSSLAVLPPPRVLSRPQRKCKGPLWAGAGGKSEGVPPPGQPGKTPLHLQCGIQWRWSETSHRAKGPQYCATLPPPVAPPPRAMSRPRIQQSTMFGPVARNIPGKIEEYPSNYVLVGPRPLERPVFVSSESFFPPPPGPLFGASEGFLCNPNGPKTWGPVPPPPMAQLCCQVVAGHPLEGPPDKRSPTEWPP